MHWRVCEMFHREHSHVTNAGNLHIIKRCRPVCTCVPLCFMYLRLDMFVFMTWTLMSGNKLVFRRLLYQNDFIIYNIGLGAFMKYWYLFDRFQRWISIFRIIKLYLWNRCVHDSFNINSLNNKSVSVIHN